MEQPIARIGCGEFARTVYGTKPGPLPAFTRMPEHEYRSNKARTEAVTADQLRLFERNPRLWHLQRSGVERDTPPPGQTPISTLVLDGRAAFENLVSASRIPPWEAANCELANIAINEHAKAREILSDGVANVVVEVPEAGVRLMQWVDYIGRHGIARLLVVEDLDDFERVHRYGPVIDELAWAAFIIDSEGSKVDRGDCYVVAVEQCQPFRCGVWVFEDQLIKRRGIDLLHVLADLEDCKSKGVYPTRFEEVRVIGGAA